jgi:CheY-like chemotaxis protein
VYDIVKQHQGYVTVKSAPGKGTAFSVYLRLLKNTPSEPLPPVEAGNIAGETVLVADNDDEDRQLIKAALEAAGCRVLEAADGEEAVEKFRNSRQKIHALVLDVIMPKMNGKETCRKIREKQPDIKVLFTSSYTEDVMFQKGMIDSNVNFILKPFSPRELLNRFKAVNAEQTPESVRDDDQ